MTYEPFYTGGTGEAMVLLHGFTDTWRSWTRVLPALQAHHAVFAPTLPGHAGGPAVDHSESATVTGLVDIIERQLDTHGIERAHLVGSSLGGWLSLELAVRGRALSVVGVCPAGGWEDGAPEVRSIVRYFRRNELMLRRARPLLRTVAAHPRSRRLALRDVIADPSRVTAAEALAMFEGAADCAVVEDFIQLTAHGRPFGELGEIDVPVRIAYGTRDRIVRWPNCYVRMRRMLPQAEFVALPGLGHLPMWEDPELVVRTILEVTDPAGAPVTSEHEAVALPSEGPAALAQL